MHPTAQLDHHRCPVCHWSFESRVPRKLNCGHAFYFCENCLKDRQSVRCNLCQHTTPIKPSNNNNNNTYRNSHNTTAQTPLPINRTSKHEMNRFDRISTTNNNNNNNNNTHHSPQIVGTMDYYESQKRDRKRARLQQQQQQQQQQQLYNNGSFTSSQNGQNNNNNSNLPYSPFLNIRKTLSKTGSGDISEGDEDSDIMTNTNNHNNNNNNNSEFEQILSMRNEVNELGNELMPQNLRKFDFILKQNNNSMNSHNNRRSIDNVISSKNKYNNNNINNNNSDSTSMGSLNAQNALMDKENINQHMRSVNNNVDSIINDYIQEVETLKRENNLYKEKNEQLLMENENLIKKCSFLENSNNSNNNNNNKIDNNSSKQIEYLQNELKRMETQYHDLKNKYNNLQLTYNNEISHKENEIMILKNENINLSNEVTYMKENQTTMMKYAFKQELSNKLMPIIKNSRNLRNKMNETKNQCTSEINTFSYELASQFNKILMHSKKIQAKADRIFKDYLKEVTLRRKYFNMIQDLKGNIRVYCRVRPLLKHEILKNDFNIIKYPDNVTIKLNTPIPQKNKEFEFDKVFNDRSRQEEVFEDTKPLITSVLDGYNVCIFAYGQTGSGKTYTMEGPNGTFTEQTELRGVNYRAINELFNVIAERRCHYYEYSLKLSIIEIYNENVADLLMTEKTRNEILNNNKNSLDLGKRNQPIYLKPTLNPHTNTVEISNLNEIECNNINDVLNALRIASSNRSMGITNMNEHSSRSHMLLSIIVNGKHLKNRNEIFYGKLHLIDLAGSERLSRSHAKGDNLREAQNINKSLSALGNVIESIKKNKSHIPYRDSKLTFLLQDSLGGQSKVLMFVNIAPSDKDLDETFCSLNFAHRVRNTSLGKAVKNTVNIVGSDNDNNNNDDGGNGFNFNIGNNDKDGNNNNNNGRIGRHTSTLRATLNPHGSRSHSSNNENMNHNSNNNSSGHFDRFNLSKSRSNSSLRNISESINNNMNNMNNNNHNNNNNNEMENNNNKYKNGKYIINSRARQSNKMRSLSHSGSTNGMFANDSSNNNSNNDIINNNMLDTRGQRRNFRSKSNSRK